MESESSADEAGEASPLTREEQLALAAFECAERGDTVELRRLAECGVDLGMVDEAGCSLAHEAAAEGQAGVVQLLGESKGGALQRVRATLSAQEAELGWTPFHAAASQGHADCIVALSQIASDPGISIWAGRDRDGGTPLHVAAMAGHVQAVHALLTTLGDRSGEPLWSRVVARDHNNLTALQGAIIEGRVETVRALVRWACTVDNAKAVARNLLGANDASGYSNAFHFGATAGQPAAITVIQDELWQHFHERSVRPVLKLLAARDADGLSPLHRAVARGHAMCCAPLDFSDASIPTSDAWGCCALDGQGRTALHLAAAGGHVNCLHELLRIGLPVRWLLRPDASHGLPTQYAAHHGQLEFLLALAQASRRPDHFPVWATGTSMRDDLASHNTDSAGDCLQSPIWQRPRPRRDCGLDSGLKVAQCGGSLLQELERDTSISEDARKVAAGATWCFLTAAYQRLAFAATFTQKSAALHLRGGAAATIDATARLPRAGNCSWLRADGTTLFEDIEMTAGWVEVLGPSLRRLVEAGHATAEVGARFRRQGGWAWNASAENGHSSIPVDLIRNRGHGDGESGSKRRSRRDRDGRKKQRRSAASKVIVVSIDE
eukprot:COSAG02_NODE_551_length_20435_cov_27.974380_4_plen_607_part_00